MTNIDSLTDLKSRLKFHIDFERDGILSAEFDDILSGVKSVIREKENWGPGNRPEQRSLWIYGESGTGKTNTIAHHLRLHRDFEFQPGMELGDHVLVVEVPSPFDIGALGRAILAQMDFSVALRMKPTDVWAHVHAQLELNQIVLVVFDEFNNSIPTAGNQGSAKKAENLAILMAKMISITNHKAWPVAIVVAGTPEIAPLLLLSEVRAQGRRAVRREFAEIGFTYKPQLAAAFKKYCERANVKSQLPTGYDIGGRSIVASRRVLGVALDYMKGAVMRAAVEDVAVNSNHLSNFFLRYNHDIVPDQNPFLSPYWENVTLPPFTPGKIHFDDLAKITLKEGKN